VEPRAEPDRKRFPLLDSEEPPRSWRRRLAIPAAVIVVVILAAGGFALVRSLTHKAPSSSAPAPTVSARGRIAVITKDQKPTTVFSHWVIGKAACGPMTKVTGPGTPVTWLP
jgi:hypothetical protein